MFFDAELLAPVLTAWADWTKTLPETANSSVVILRLPPLEFIPEPLRGKTVLNVRFAFVGDAAEGKRLFQPIRDAGTTLIDAVGEMPASDIALIHNDPKDPTAVFDRGVMLTALDADFIEAFLDAAGPDQQLPLVAVELRHLGGRRTRRTRRQCRRRSWWGRHAGDDRRPGSEPVFEQVLPATIDGILTKLGPWISPNVGELRRRLHPARVLPGILAGRHLHPPRRGPRDVRPFEGLPLRA